METTVKLKIEPSETVQAKVATTETAKASKKRKKVKYCIVPYCKSKNTDEVEDRETLSFHEIPCDAELRALFVAFINRGPDKKGNPWVPGQKSLICSRHFDPLCFKYMTNGGRRLILGSLPTILPDLNPTVQANIKKQKKAMKRSNSAVQYPVPSEGGVTDEDLEMFSESEDEFISKKIKQEPMEPAHCLEDLCRLCSEPCVNNCVNVFARRAPMRLCFMINFCLPIQVSTTDILPLNICISCEAKVEEFYKFALQCKNSENDMMEMYNAQKLLQLPSLQGPVTPVEPMQRRQRSNTKKSSAAKPGPSSGTHTSLAAANLIPSDLLEVSYEIQTFDCKYCHGVFYNKKKCEMHMRKSHREKMKEDLNDKTTIRQQVNRSIKVAAKEGKIKFIETESAEPKQKTAEKTPKVRGPKPIEEPTPCVCDECGKMFRSRHYMKIHIKRHSTVKNYICHVCGASFITSGDLSTHGQTHSTDKVCCNICHQSFKYKRILAEHMFAFHLERYRYICMECNDYFQTKREIQEHLKKHDGKGTFIKYFMNRCPVCKKDCHTRYQRQLHMQRKHKNVKVKLTKSPFVHKCKLCVKTFKTGASFKKHYERRHPNMAIDTEPRPRFKPSAVPYQFHCAFCNKNFKYSANFSRHMKDKHSTEIVEIKVVKDKETTASIDDQKVLIETVFQCNYCESRFDNIEQLQSHKIDLHQTKT